MNRDEINQRLEENKQQELQLLNEANRQHGIILGQRQLLQELLAALDKPVAEPNGKRPLPEKVKA